MNFFSFSYGALEKYAFLLFHFNTTLLAKDSLTARLLVIH